MRAGGALVWLAALAMAALLPGCGHTVKGVCDDLNEACSSVPYNDCVKNGQELEKVSESRGCGDEFDAYIDCVAEAECGWDTACEKSREALETCAGEFPE